MSAYYLDTSALIKRYVTETGSSWLLNLFSHPNLLLFTTRVTTVEVRSVLARRRRETSITSKNHTDALKAFSEDSLTQYRFIDFDTIIADRAGELLDRHPLRAYDAIQLASALRINEVLTTANLSSPTFLSADNKLLAVAAAEGLPSDNPNDHP